MKLRSTVTMLLAFATAACREAPSPQPHASSARGPDAAAIAQTDLSAEAAREIATVLVRADVPATVEHGAVVALGHRIEPHVGVDRVIPASDHATASIDVRIVLDGAPVEALHTTAIGIDANANEAVQHAIREWNVGYGIPMIDALRALAAPPGDGGDAIRGPAGLTLGPFAAFPGPTGLRGEAPANWQRGTPEMHHAFLDRFATALDDLLPRTQRAGFHSLKIVMHVRNGAGGEGECRVDDVVNSHLCDLARSFPWPQGPEEYIFKQFYLLVPRQR